MNSVGKPTMYKKKGVTPMCTSEDEKMNKNELLSSLRSLFPFSSLDFRNVFSNIYDLFDRYVTGQYKRYKAEKRIQKLTEYKEYINYCYSFYQRELELLNTSMTEQLSSTQFSEFFFYAKKRWRKQYQKELLYQSLCFDDHSFDEKTMQIFHIVRLWKDCDSLSQEILNMKAKFPLVSQSFLSCYSVSVNYMKSILPFALNMTFNDIAKSEALNSEDVNQLTDQSINFEINQFYMSIAQFAFYARKQKNLTQQNLSELSGVKRSTIAKMETLKQIPSYETLIQLLSFFGARLTICFSSTPDTDGRDHLLTGTNLYDIQ